MRLPKDLNSEQVAQAIIPGSSQRIAVTNSNAQSNGFTAGTKLVKLFATVDVWIVFGTNPVAVANDGSSFFLPGGICAHFGVPSTATKLGVIRDSSNGTLHLLEAKQ